MLRATIIYATYMQACCEVELKFTARAERTLDEWTLERTEMHGGIRCT